MSCDAHAHAGVLEDARRVLEPEADQPQRLLVRPRAAEALDERRLGRHPVRLGVDEGAVHVPEDGGERGRVHWSMLPSDAGRPGAPGAAGSPRRRDPSSGAGLSWKEPARRAEEVAWTDWDAECSSPRSTAGTTPARPRRPRSRICARAATYETVFSVDPELYFDYQYTRPQIAIDGDGKRDAALARGHAAAARRARRGGTQLWLLTGVEPARAWQAFAARVHRRRAARGHHRLRRDRLDDVGRAAHAPDLGLRRQRQRAAAHDARAGAQHVRGPGRHPRACSAHAADAAGIPSASLWASVPHYVAGHTPSPKATLALLDRLEDLTGAPVPRGELATESAAWEASIDAAAADDEEMTEYIRQLERTRDTWDSPEASGDAIAQEFERYLAPAAATGRPSPGATTRAGSGRRSRRGPRQYGLRCTPDAQQHEQQRRPARRGRPRTAGSCASRSSS